jgi:hypothetical protein
MGLGCRSIRSQIIRHGQRSWSYDDLDRSSDGVFLLVPEGFFIVVSTACVWMMQLSTSL